jgi:hypothetical protein
MVMTAYLGASAESERKMRVFVPLAAKASRVGMYTDRPSYACTELGDQSHLHNDPVPLNAFGHLLGNPGKEPVHAAYQ